MSDEKGHDDGSTAVDPTDRGLMDTTRTYSTEELDGMSRDDLVKLGTNLDGVDVAFRRHRWPVPGTKAEKRA